MKFYSEKTNKYYDSQDECLKAEEKYETDLAEARAKKEALASERKARASEVEAALKAVKDAEDKYFELLDAFIKDYKSYHYTTTNIGDFPFRSMFSIFKPFDKWFYD